MTSDRILHDALIGRQGSRADLNTPVLILDRDALDRNIARMAALTKAAGVALRPHAKTHKSVAIARRHQEIPLARDTCHPQKPGNPSLISTAAIPAVPRRPNCYCPCHVPCHCP